MDSGFYSAFTGLAARMQSLDVSGQQSGQRQHGGLQRRKRNLPIPSAPSLNNGWLSPVNQAINDSGVLGGSRMDLTAEAR